MFLDIAFGLLVAHAATWLQDIELQTWHLVFGVIFALLPDLDAVTHYIRTRQVAAYADSPTDHRDGLHYPLVYLSAGTVLCAVVGKIVGHYEIAVLFLLASTLHFFHDSVGTGWGVKWLWPVSKHSYKLFCEKNGDWSSRFFVSWDPEELREVIIRHGDPDWIRNLFVQPLVRALSFQALPPMGLTIMLLLEVVIPITFIIYILL